MKRVFRKLCGITICSVMLTEMMAPIAAYALTSGPVQPEFSSFEPIGTTGMVNEFTGQFTYNLPIMEVPGPNGSSYPITLTYHSGGGLEDDASWVGHGWSLNAGAINRSVRGLPDDDNGVAINYSNKQESVVTWVIGVVGTLQAASHDVFSFDQAHTFNSMVGYSVTSGFAISLGNFLSLNWRTQNGQTRFTARPDWKSVAAYAVKTLSSKETHNYTSSQVPNYAGPPTLAQALASRDRKLAKAKDNTRTSGIIGSLYGGVGDFVGRSLVSYTAPSINANSVSASVSVSFGGTVDFTPGLPVMIGGHGGIRGSLSIHSTDDQDTRHGYGMMYAAEGSGEDDNVVYDVSRDRDNDFSSRDRYLSPSYAMTDAFYFQGHGVNGSARIVHQSIGYTGPTPMESVNGSLTIGAEIGAGVGEFSIGGSASLAVGNQSVDALQLAGSASSYSSFTSSGTYGNHQNVFLRTSGELSNSVRYSQTDGLLAPFITMSGSSGFSISLPSTGLSRALPTAEGEKPKVSNAVSFRTNAELIAHPSARTGWSCDSSITPWRYPMSSTLPTDAFIDRNEAGIKDGIGEVSVTNPNGVTYVYGLPVYSRAELDITYTGSSARNNVAHNNRLVRYPLDRVKGSRVQEYRAAPYAHTFLLTEIYTPDYVDLGDEGPGLDDLGGYVSLRYRRAAGTQLKTPMPNKDPREWYSWRTPYMGYSYNEGEISKTYDDRSHVKMGEKELYYVSAIETKTHVALFITNKTKHQQITIGGETVDISGSDQERLDAYEAFTGLKRVYDAGEYSTEDISGRFPQPGKTLPTSLDGAPSAPFENKYLGGKGFLGRTQRIQVTPSWVNKNTRKNKSERLEKIVLIAKNDAGEYTEILQTVNMEYTYELMSRRGAKQVEDKYWNESTWESVYYDQQEWDDIYWATGLLNSAYYLTTEAVDGSGIGKYVNLGQHGKLTLKRLWTDYGAVRNQTISPYVFHYEYPLDDYNDFYWDRDVGLNSVWNAAESYGEMFTTTDPDANKAVQNPHYDPTLANAWGEYVNTMPESYLHKRLHHSQKTVAGVTYGTYGGVYDPAAWQLKRIGLPSGAEIHVQYEQGSYSYVQNKPAMALVKLDDVTFDQVGNMVVDLNINQELPGRGGAQAVVKVLNEYLKDNDRLFFKFLYPTADCDVAPTVSWPPRSAEFLSGFSPIDSTDVAIVSPGTSNERLRILFRSSPAPTELMKEYLFNRSGEFPPCSPQEVKYLPGKPDPDNRSEIAQWKSVINAGTKLQERHNSLSSLYSGTGPVPFLNYSFVRIPCVWKYGGGIRVKRIFLHDKGLEVDPTDEDRSASGGLYGVEYHYDVEESGVVKSSGVATNEPPGLREENPLFTFLPSKDDQSWYERVTAGEEIDQFGGPVAPGAMPGPSVGYSRVITTSIAQVVTSPGYTVTEFETCKDHPVVVSSSPISKRKDLQPLLMSGVVNIQVDKIAATQGFVIKTNEMHGKPKAVSKYAGTYDQGSSYLVESMKYDYYSPYEEKPVLVKNSTMTGHEVQMKHIGVEEELHIDAREYSSVSGSAAVPYDVGITIVGIVIAPYAHVGFPTLNVATTSAKIATVTRTLHYPTVVRQTTAVRNGIVTTAVNEAFDELTGTPVVVRTYDQYHAMEDDDGYVRDITLPAHYVYGGMGSAFGHDMKAVEGVDYDLDATGGAVITSDVTELGLHQADVIMIEGPVSGEAATAGVLSFDDVAQEWELEELSRTSGFTGSGTGTVRILRCGNANRLTEPALLIRQVGNAWGSGPDPTPFLSSMSDVVSAQAHIYERDWTEYPEIAASGTQVHSLGRSRRWHVKTSTVWQAITSDLIANPSSTVHTSGVAASSMLIPDFYSNTTTSGWIATSTGSLWDAHNQRIEEENAIGIPSAVVFTEPTGQPECIARNARYGTVAFESYETFSSGSINATDAHTGARSLEEGSGYTNTGVVVTPRQDGEVELVVKAWIKARGTGVACSLKINNVAYSMKISPQVNGWSLVEGVIPGTAVDAMTLGSNNEISMDITGSSATPLIDDVKVQPKAASMMCYVYHPPTMRLIAQFDDQHFAQIFKYDQEGRLARKDKETIRGVFPIAEMHINRPGVQYAVATQGGQAIMQSLGLDPFDRSFQWPSLNAPLTMPPTGVDATIDMLRLDVNPRRIRYKLFDRDSVDIRPDSVAKDVLLRTDSTKTHRSRIREERK